MSTAIPTFPIFDYEGSPNTVISRWKRWTEKLENLFTAMAIAEEKQKRALLRHFLDEESEDIYCSLSTGDTFKSAVEAMTAHFALKQNVEYEAFTFRQIKQRSGETLDQFVSRLRKAAKSCDFNDEEKEIKSQLILGCESSSLRKYALRNAEKKLEEVINYGRVGEATEEQVREIENLNIGKINLCENRSACYKNKPEERREKYRYQKNHQMAQNDQRCSDSIKEIKSCSFCGEEWHNNIGECRARGKICNYCYKPNHLSRVCLKRISKDKETKQKSYYLNKNDITSDDLNSDNFEGDNQVLTNFQCKNKEKNISLHETVLLQLQNKMIEFIVDTGSTRNMLNYDEFLSVNIKTEIKKDDNATYVYGSVNPMEVIGVVTLPVKFENKTYMLDFTIPKHNGPSLLGKNSLIRLGIVKFMFGQSVNAMGDNESVESIENILSSYDCLFKGVGKCKSAQIKLHINNDIKPIVQKHRRIPFHIRGRVEEELGMLIKEDIIERVPEKQPSTWISPIVIVPKKDNNLRICIDMTLANQAILRERHITPTTDDIIDILNGATWFSKLDLAKGYHQFELMEESRHVTTFTTHIGCFRYKRLNFGITSAAEIFQHEVAKIIKNIPGSINMSDDILIYGRTIEDHDKALIAVLNSLQIHGLTLNKAKCTFRRRELKFLGLIFTDKGIRADEEKIKAIANMKRPSHQKELKSFLGMINFCARFLPNLAVVSKPLRNLNKNTVKWNWSEEHEEAFTEIQELLNKSECLSYFNKDSKTEIWVDAGPSGIGVILTQVDKGGKHHIISYASHLLSDIEMKYSQIEKEALGIIWSIKHYHMYLFGSSFKVWTDHKPLLTIFNKPNVILSPRLERWKFKLQPYDFEVCFVPGKDNPADFISRHPLINKDLNNSSKSISESYVNFVIACSAPIRMSMDEIIKHTKQDSIIQQVIDCVHTGMWDKVKKEKELMAYMKIKYELSTNKERSILLRGHRIVVPKALWTKILEVAHNTHLGIVKTKSLLRDKVWFPGMSRMVESWIGKCINCQSVNKVEGAVPLQLSKMPHRPWSVINVDHKGPLANGEYLLVLVDQYSKFPVVEVVSSTSAKVNIEKLSNIFSTFGFPTQVITDNGPPFQSYEFKSFVEQHGVAHHRITPLWPRANGQVERFNETINKILKISKQNAQNWKQQMNQLLHDYRNSRHCTTKVSPSSLMFSYKSNFKIPEASQLNIAIDDEEVRKRCETANEKVMGRFKKQNPKTIPMPKIGDKVLVQRKVVSKGSSRFEPNPLIVTEVKGSQITASRHGFSITRNMSFFKIIPSEEEDDYGEQKSKEEKQSKIQEEVGKEKVSEDNDESSGDKDRGYALRKNISKPKRLIEEK